MVYRHVVAAVLLGALAALPQAGGAQPAAKPAPSSNAGHQPAAYDTFVKGATVAPGFIAIVEKDGATYFALQTAQIGADLIETSVPRSGLGGFGPAPGEPYVAPARILRFERYGDKIVLRWPNTYAVAQKNSPERAGVDQSLPSSVIAVVPIVAQDAGHVVISAAPFLGDLADLAADLPDANGSPAHAYHLDPTRSFFLAAKAFPENDVLRVDQTWVSPEPATLDNAPDARNVEVKITYNLVQAPDDGYVPRIYDPRVGYFSQPLLDFSSDDRLQRDVYYICRWNFGARSSAAPASAAHPIVFYLSNDIPQRYRATVRAALLTWNDAFEHVGILDAIQVQQQPDDPAWDPDDIRHNMIRWVDTSDPQYGAEALLLTDPRSGEELNVGVNFDAVVDLSGGLLYKYEIAPARGLPDTQAAQDAFTQSEVRSIVLHESGHDLGLQHNFIGHEAYTAHDLQSVAFTRKYGVASSVMEYAPLNLWPSNTQQGEYDQLVLGPYDYYAIRYGYGYIPSTASSQMQRTTLQRWASGWTNPLFRFASDEDADEFANGRSVDPRVVTYNLTNHPLAWCATQLSMLHGVMDAVNARFPEPGQPYDEARAAFLTPMRSYLRCATDAAHTIGGEYLSRAQRGRSNAAAVTPVSRAEEARAWHALSTWLFSDAAWDFNPRVLDLLTSSEISTLSTNATWAYKPPDSHVVRVDAIAAAAQQSTLQELFSPNRLARIDGLSLRYGAGKTMTLADLFDWAQDSIFGDIPNGGVARDGVVRRNLQSTYAQLLAGMVLHPQAGVPADASALARLQLENLRHATTVALQNSHLSEMTRAHLEALLAVADQTLSAHASIAGQAAPENPGA